MWLIEDPGDFSDKIEARRRIRHQDPRWSNVRFPSDVRRGAPMSTNVYLIQW